MADPPRTFDAQNGRPASSGRLRAEAGVDVGVTATDADLVGRLVHDDRDAFAVLYDRYRRQAYSLARRICADEVLAEDVVQEAFLALWRNPARYRPEQGSFSTWLLTVVHHRAVDAVRRERAQRDRADSAADAVALETGPPADHEALIAVLGGEVRRALAQLPDDQRQVLALAYFAGYTQREVAALTGVPLGTVKSRMFSGIRRLRTLLSALINGGGASGIAGGSGEVRGQER